MKTPRVLITPEAENVVTELKGRFGELMFHQSGGCCDGSQPMCFEKGEFKTGESDVFLGEISGCAFFMSRDQFEYWQHTQLTIDVTPGRGSSFSLEIPMGVRFITRSRMFSHEEAGNLVEVGSGIQAD
ncbi:DUF779 domain-containing protein [Dyadobacter sp. CY345]|uniref:DUF779 domain-containing protein n=1 Tax=Dyadobacter sp. CY345 TaxID=2909335 RepID=UPI001F47F292|nr:DUF779 domain-containing protein [Dyadobacter sp. CY345]MCF2447710.1 DUF779 domain-containing protein [Dyadobacter sp. CY345]